MMIKKAFIAMGANLKSDLTGSGWSPYFTQIHLYRDLDEEPVMIANVPRAIKMRDDIYKFTIVVVHI